MSEKNYDDETLDAICDGLDYRGHQTGAEAIRQLRAANARLVAAGDAMNEYIAELRAKLNAEKTAQGPEYKELGMKSFSVQAHWRAAKEQQK